MPYSEALDWREYDSYDHFFDTMVNPPQITPGRIGLDAAHKVDYDTCYDCVHSMAGKCGRDGHVIPRRNTKACDKFPGRRHV